MKPMLTALLGGFQAEIMQMARSRLFVALTVVQALTFLFLVSLFGMTGSFAPTAVISEDQGHMQRHLSQNLQPHITPSTCAQWTRPQLKRL